MELLVTLLAGALGANLARGLRRDRPGFVLASALGIVGGGLSGLALSRSGLGGLSHAAAVDGTGIDPLALVVQVGVSAGGAAILVVVSGLTARRDPE